MNRVGGPVVASCGVLEIEGRGKWYYYYFYNRPSSQNPCHSVDVV